MQLLSIENQSSKQTTVSYNRASEAWKIQTIMYITVFLSCGVYSKMICFRKLTLVSASDAETVCTLVPIEAVS